MSFESLLYSDAELAMMAADLLVRREEMPHEDAALVDEITGANIFTSDDTAKLDRVVHLHRFYNP